GKSYQFKMRKKKLQPLHLLPASVAQRHRRHQSRFCQFLFSVWVEIVIWPHRFGTGFVRDVYLHEGASVGCADERTEHRGAPPVAGAVVWKFSYARKLMITSQIIGGGGGG